MTLLALIMFSLLQFHLDILKGRLVLLTSKIWIDLVLLIKDWHKKSKVHGASWTRWYRLKTQEVKTHSGGESMSWGEM